MFKQLIKKARTDGGVGYSWEQVESLVGKKAYIQVITAPQEGEGWAKIISAGTENGEFFVSWYKDGRQYTRKWSDISVNRSIMGYVQKSVVSFAVLGLCFGIYKLIKK